MKILRAYTDGSFYRSVPGWGFIVVDENDHIVSEACGYVQERHLWKHNNIAGEIRAIEELIGMLGISMLDFQHLIIHTDLELAVEIAKGNWEAKIPLTRNYKQMVDEAREDLGYSLEFVWIKGHSGNDFHDYVDALAKEGSTLMEKNNAN